jgi:hypothetical protein
MRRSLWILPIFVLGCSGNESGPIVNTGTGGSATGGSTSGGTPGAGGNTSMTSGGTSTTGGGSSTGTGGAGTTTGGAATAGTSAGGTSTGGAGTTTGGAAKGGATSAGGAPATTGGAATGGAGTTTGGAPAGGSGGGSTGSTTGPLGDRISTTNVTIPAGVKAGVRNYRIWGAVNFKVAPVYTAPQANCGTLVCFTTGTASAPNARVVRLDANDQIKDALDLGAGLECRGVAAEPDGHFAALLWNGANDTINVTRYDASGAKGTSTALTNSDNKPTDFGIGESRLEFGGGKYGAYYHVHSDSGHEGDTLKYVAAATGAETTTWSWGCSHSMSNLLTFNPASSSFMPACVTDCYPGTTGSDFATASIGGVYLNNRTKVLDVDAGCNGSVAGELGGAAVAPMGWKITFNAHQAPATNGDMSYMKSSMNQDIAFASIGANLMPSPVVWLTTTSGVNEADSGIVRWEPAGDAAEQYVVGWMEGGVYKLGRVDAAGKFLEMPADVTAKAKWGERDDPFRQHVNKDVVWAWFDAAGSTTLKFARLKSGATGTCAAF